MTAPQSRVPLLSLAEAPWLQTLKMAAEELRTDVGNVGIAWPNKPSRMYFYAIDPSLVTRSTAAEEPTA